MTFVRKMLVANLAQNNDIVIYVQSQKTELNNETSFMNNIYVLYASTIYNACNCSYVPINYNYAVSE